MGNHKKRIAVVLAGAVAQGAFEAGAIQALVRADVEIVRIVAASSGALNGTVLASGLRTRNAIAGAETLAMLWRDHAEWNEVFHASFRDLLKRDGLSDQKRLRGLLREHVPPSQPEDPAAIHLRLIVAALHGCIGNIGPRPATTFESVRDFHTGDFGSAEGLEAVFTAAVASSALPLVFAPVEVPGVGPCVDGGAVNNTPMKWALDGPLGAQIEAIVVIATSVEQRREPVDVSGFTAYVGHVISMLIEERLYRDLRESEQLNAGLAVLDDMLHRGELSPSQLDRIKRGFGLEDRRTVDILSIRPLAPLPGTAFSGFFDADLRAAYLDAGFRRGLEVLGPAQRAWREAAAPPPAPTPPAGLSEERLD
jgi:NTE family protein